MRVLLSFEEYQSLLVQKCGITAADVEAEASEIETQIPGYPKNYYASLVARKHKLDIKGKIVHKKADPINASSFEDFAAGDRGSIRVYLLSMTPRDTHINYRVVDEKYKEFLLMDFAPPADKQTLKDVFQKGRKVSLKDVYCKTGLGGPSLVFGHYSNFTVLKQDLEPHLYQRFDAIPHGTYCRVEGIVLSDSYSISGRGFVRFTLLSKYPGRSLTVKMFSDTVDKLSDRFDPQTGCEGWEISLTGIYKEKETWKKKGDENPYTSYDIFYADDLTVLKENDLTAILTLGNPISIKEAILEPITKIIDAPMVKLESLFTFSDMIPKQVVARHIGDAQCEEYISQGFLCVNEGGLTLGEPNTPPNNPSGSSQKERVDAVYSTIRSIQKEHGDSARLDEIIKHSGLDKIVVTETLRVLMDDGMIYQPLHETWRIL